MYEEERFMHLRMCQRVACQVPPKNTEVQPTRKMMQYFMATTQKNVHHARHM